MAVGSVGFYIAGSFIIALSPLLRCAYPHRSPVFLLVSGIRGDDIVGRSVVLNDDKPFLAFRIPGRHNFGNL